MGGQWDSTGTPSPAYLQDPVPYSFKSLFPPVTHKAFSTFI